MQHLITLPLKVVGNGVENSVALYESNTNVCAHSDDDENCSIANIYLGTESDTEPVFCFYHFSKYVLARETGDVLVAYKNK